MNEMTTETIPIQVPEALYRRLERLAALTHRPVESLVVQTLSSSIPPLPDDLPPPTRDALTSLEGLSDDDLWQMVRSGMPEVEYEQFTELRAKHRAGTIAPDEQATLDRLTRDATGVRASASRSTRRRDCAGEPLARLHPLQRLQGRSNRCR